MKILTIYNTCGIKHEHVSWYEHCLQSILGQDYSDNKVLVSSCINSDNCTSHLKNVFGKKIDICRFKDPYTVNITFNKSVQEAVKRYGEFDGYFYIDSGVLLNNPDVIKSAIERLKTTKYAMISYQTDTDTGFEPLGFRQDSNTVQIVGDDFNIPIGKACNLHAQVFDHSIYKTFDSRIIPDIFRAYCTESTFSFLCAVVQKDWTIVKDILLHHNKGVDGASIGQDHISKQYMTPWNNLLYNRDAMEFINDGEAKSVGLGYEECNNIMNHDPEAFNENYAKYPKELAEQILKYFYTAKEELDYDNIRTEYV